MNFQAGRITEVAQEPEVQGSCVEINCPVSFTTAEILRAWVDTYSFVLICLLTPILSSVRSTATNHLSLY